MSSGKEGWVFGFWPGGRGVTHLVCVHVHVENSVRLAWQMEVVKYGRNILKLAREIGGGQRKLWTSVHFIFFYFIFLWCWGENILSWWTVVSECCWGGFPPQLLCQCKDLSASSCLFFSIIKCLKSFSNSATCTKCLLGRLLAVSVESWASAAAVLSLFASGNTAANGDGNFWCDAHLPVALLSPSLNAVVQR